MQGGNAIDIGSEGFQPSRDRTAVDGVRVLACLVIALSLVANQNVSFTPEPTF